jgi:hypothetical protein
MRLSSSITARSISGARRVSKKSRLNVATTLCGAI